MGKIWHAEIREGNKTVKSFSGYETKRKLELDAWEVLKKLKQGSTLNSKMTLLDLYHKWFKVKIEPSERLKSTVKRYTQIELKIEKFLNYPILEIKPSFYQQQLDIMGQTVNRDMLKRLNSVIRKCLDFAKADKIIFDDFTVGAEFRSQKKAKPNDEKYIHSSADYLRLLEYLRACLDYTASVIPFYLYLLFQTGLRPAECLGLTWDCVDFEKAMVEMKVPVSTIDLKITHAKTEISKRKIPVNQETLEVLRKLKSEQAKTNNKLEIFNKHKFVFQHYGYKKKLPNGGSSNKYLKNIMEKLGIEPVTVYGARHKP